MAYKIQHHGPAVQLRDPEAVVLVKARAKREGRSCANALAKTVIEVLGTVSDQHSQHTQDGSNGQDKIKTNSIPAAGGELIHGEDNR